MKSRANRFRKTFLDHRRSDDRRATIALAIDLLGDSNFILVPEHPSHILDSGRQQGAGSVKEHTPNDELSPEATARRRDEVIKRMLNTPPQPRRARHEPEPKRAKSRKPGKARSKPPS